MSYLAEHDLHTRREGGWRCWVMYLETALGTVMVEQCDECPIYFGADCT